MGSNSELFWLVPRRGDVGVAGSTSRSRNDSSGQKSLNYKYELTARDTRLFKNCRIVAPEDKPRGGVATLRRTWRLSRTAARRLFFNNLQKNRKVFNILSSPLCQTKREPDTRSPCLLFLFQIKAASSLARLRLLNVLPVRLLHRLDPRHLDVIFDLILELINHFQRIFSRDASRCNASDWLEWWNPASRRSKCISMHRTSGRNRRISRQTCGPCSVDIAYNPSS